MFAKFICAGNWKLNHGIEETRKFIEEFAKDVSAGEMDNFALFLPALTLHQLSGNSSLKNLNWGAQNVYWEKSGAFTGENSAAVVREIGGTHVLVGHSERRSLFGETNEDTQKKMQAIAAEGMTPVLCVGETLEQRKAGETLSVICHQLKVALKDWDHHKPFWVAYEPVWAIGTGEVATPEQANEAHKALHDELKEMFPDDANAIPILYGGSVKPENAFELGKKAYVNGFLIGGASLKVDSFVRIFREGLQAKL